jgi:hypothetical protein
MNITQLTALLLIVLPIAFNATFFLLQRTFEYPDILRQPTEYILTRFRQGGQRLIAYWYAFMLASLLFTPAAVLVPQILAPKDVLYLAMTMVVGVLAALVQFLGLIRWPFLVPHLAKTFLDPAASQATRDAVAVVFQAFHRYAGVAIGEHLGYLFTSIWTALIAVGIIRSPLFGAWLGWAGLIPALGIFMGMLEESGLKIAGVINAVSYIVWSIWLILIGIALLAI